MDRTTRVLVMVCAAVAALAWGRLLWSTATTASPAHQIDFVDEEGRPLVRWDVHCHGPMYVHGADAWQRCMRTVDELEVDRLTHFDLEGRTATLLSTPTGVADLYSVTAVAPHPQGGLVMVAEDDLLRVTRDGVTRLAESPSFHTTCLRVHGDSIELATFAGLQAQRSTLDSRTGRWETLTGTRPDSAAGRSIRGAGCRWSDGWRFVWAAVPEVHAGDGPLPVSLLEAGLDGVPKETQTLEFPVRGPNDFGTEQTPAARRAEDGSAFLDQPLLDLSPWFGVPRSWSATPPLEWHDGRWEPPRLPPGMSTLLTASDFQVTNDRIHTVLTFESSGHARVGGSWLQAEEDEDRDLRVRRLDENFEAGEPSSPVTGTFWMNVGFKLLPTESGGYWMMGGLGEAVVRVDDDFQRTDRLGLFERLGRAMTNDRAKRNSDFFLNVGWFHRFGFLWTLFGGLLVAAVLRAKPSAVRGLGGLYLAGVIVSGYSFWKLSGVFW